MGLFSDVKLKAFIGDEKIKSIYHGDTRQYSSGNIVTYQIDTDVAYQEEVSSGEFFLSPKTFTIPSKEGYTFRGWKQNNIADSFTLNSSLIMGDTPITLYAVYEKQIPVKFVFSPSKERTLSVYHYYNNGNIQRKNITTPTTQYHDSYTDYSFYGWSNSTNVNASVDILGNREISVENSITFYALYRKLHSITWVEDVNVYNTENYYSYINGSGNNISHTTLTAPSSTYKSDMTFSGWSSYSDVNSAWCNVQYKSGYQLVLSQNMTFYGVWYTSVTLGFSSGASGTTGTMSSRSGYCYWCYNAYKAASMSLPYCSFRRTNYTFAGWRVNGTVYQAYSYVELTSSTTAYATWKRSS